MRLERLTPDSIPYSYPVQVTAKGSGFYGLRSALFVAPDGQRFPAIVSTSGMVDDSLVTLITPGGFPRWATIDVIVSEAPAVGEELPYHQSDTLKNALFTVGPVPGDTLVYEYRIFSSGKIRVRRWDLSDFPLKVYFEPMWPTTFVEDLWQGIRAWEDTISPDIPSFIRVSNMEIADVVFEIDSQPYRAATRKEMGNGPTIQRAFVMIGEGRWSEEADSKDIFLGAHEMGHALGLPHSHRSQDVMRAGGLPWEDSGISEGDIHTLRALYAAEPGPGPPY